MPAPDLPPPIVHALPARAVLAHLTPASVAPHVLGGCGVVMVDALRASVTIARALCSGAREVLPALSVDEARALAGALPPSSFILGGERGGLRIEGFDLGNSPAEYTPGRVAGKTVIFTTTNGTAALRHAHQARLVLIGSLVNRSAVCDALAGDEQPVHVLCAGTRGELTLDDALAAGAIVQGLVDRGRSSAGDGAELCRLAYTSALTSPGGLEASMLNTRGGRNLRAIGLDHDVARCCELDTIPLAPACTPPNGAIRGQ